MINCEEGPCLPPKQPKRKLCCEIGHGHSHEPHQIHINNCKCHPNKAQLINCQLNQEYTPIYMLAIAVQDHTDMDNLKI